MFVRLQLCYQLPVVTSKAMLILAAALALGACKRSHDQGSEDGRSTVPTIPVNVVQEQKPLRCPDGTDNRSAGMHEWCERTDGTRHGPAVMRLACNGVPTLHETYRDGELHGDRIEWHIGVPVGDELVTQPDVCTWLEAHPDDITRVIRTRAAVTPYVRGKAHGMHTSWSTAGNKRTEGAYRDGLAHGTWRGWNDEGKQLGTYEMNDGTGVRTEWYDSGAKREEWRYKDGKRHGRYRQWHADGQLAREGMFAGDLADGTWKQWSTEGELLGTYGMKAGTGVQRIWNDDGSLRTEVSLEDGEPVDS